MNQIISTELLKGYGEPQWYAKDHFIQTPDKKYALYFYNIKEESMQAYYANLAIFSENKFDSPLLSSGKVRIWYIHRQTLTYAQISGCLIFRMPEMNKVFNPLKPVFPYLLIKPETSQFSLIDWDVTSIYYSLEEISENIVVVKEESPKELDRFNAVRRTGEIININELTWYNFKQFDDASDIYVNR